MANLFIAFWKIIFYFSFWSISLFYWCFDIYSSISAALLFYKVSRDRSEFILNRKLIWLMLSNLIFLFVIAFLTFWSAEFNKYFVSIFPKFCWVLLRLDSLKLFCLEVVSCCYLFFQKLYDSRRYFYAF